MLKPFVVMVDPTSRLEKIYGASSYQPYMRDDLDGIWEAAVQLCLSTMQEICPSVFLPTSSRYILSAADIWLTCERGPDILSLEGGDCFLFMYIIYLIDDANTPLGIFSLDLISHSLQCPVALLVRYINPSVNTNLEIELHNSILNCSRCNYV
jgi:hypothetical protein